MFNNFSLIFISVFLATPSEACFGYDGLNYLGGGGGGCGGGFGGGCGGGGGGYGIGGGYGYSGYGIGGGYGGMGYGMNYGVGGCGGYGGGIGKRDTESKRKLVVRMESFIEIEQKKIK